MIIVISIMMEKTKMNTVTIQWYDDADSNNTTKYQEQQPSEE
jgi:hypothetical protein